ncbi:hypothetical protein QBC42DRAFT_279418 [Cladorrhinum samala]|uniref:C2H2-type domain-containing protein n=1 Tax=Cladorrhinum samala TaxID=585594 RepID=A0AAV9HC36_9PEZI|nr:hypothetical protein QBC42DRAFT_279418 [Cladorrhinum samala]
MDATVCTCGKRLANAAALKQHRRDSPNHKTFACDCGARFETAGDRDQHRRDSRLHAPKTTSDTKKSVAQSAQEVVVVQTGSPSSSNVVPAASDIPGTSKSNSNSAESNSNNNLETQSVAAAAATEAVQNVPAGVPAANISTPALEVKPDAPSAKTVTATTTTTTTTTTAVSTSNTSPGVFRCCGRNFKAKEHLTQHREDSPRHAGEQKATTVAAAAQSSGTITISPSSSSSSSSNKKKETGNQNPAATAATAAQPSGTGSSPSSSSSSKKKKKNTAATAPAPDPVRAPQAAPKNKKAHGKTGAGSRSSSAGSSWSNVSYRDHYDDDGNDYYYSRYVEDLDWSICDKDCGWCGHCRDGADF